MKEEGEPNPPAPFPMREGGEIKASLKSRREIFSSAFLNALVALSKRRGTQSFSLI